MVTLYDVWNLTDPESNKLIPALVMEFVEGQNLRDSPGPFSMENFKEWSETIISFLTKIREGKTHHGDLHDGNIMISGDELRILDPYHRDSSIASSTRSQDSWHRSDVREARMLLEALLLKVESSESATTAFCSHNPKLTTIEELKEAATIAIEQHTARPVGD